MQDITTAVVWVEGKPSERNSFSKFVQVCTAVVFSIRYSVFRIDRVSIGQNGSASAKTSGNGDRSYRYYYSLQYYSININKTETDIVPGTYDKSSNADHKQQKPLQHAGCWWLAGPGTGYFVPYWLLILHPRLYVHPGIKPITFLGL